MGWREAYTKREFKFPWKIAEFVMNAKRLEQNELMLDEHYELITKCWNHNPVEKLSIQEIIKELEMLLE